MRSFHRFQGQTVRNASVANLILYTYIKSKKHRHDGLVGYSARFTLRTREVKSSILFRVTFLAVCGHR